MPRKIRELIQDLERAGFVNRADGAVTETTYIRVGLG
jgi:hypothetical protein